MATDKKKKSVAAVLKEILDLLGDRKLPNEELQKAGRAALRAKTKTLKAATAAAAASGNSGRKQKYDREAIAKAEGTAAEVARTFGCSPALVSLIWKETGRK